MEVFNSPYRPKKDIFGTWKLNDFTSWHSFFSSPAWGWLLFFFFSFLITLLLTFKFETLPSQVRVDSFAQKDIKADQNYEVVDHKSTEKNRQEAVSNVLPIYDYNEGVLLEIDGKVQETFEKAKAYLYRHPRVTGAGLKTFLQEELGLEFSEEQIRFLITHRFRPELENDIRHLIRQFQSFLIVEDFSSLNQSGTQGIVIRRVKNDHQEYVERNFSGIYSIEEIGRQIQEKIKKGFWDASLQKGSEALLTSVVSHFIRPTLTYNVSETELRRSKAFASAKPVIIKIQAGESIIRSGSRFEPRHITILEGIQRQKRQTNLLVKYAGSFVFISLFFLVTYAFAARFIKKFSTQRKDLIFLGLHFLMILIFVRLIVALAGVLKDSFPFSIQVQTFYYMAPIAAGAMLVRLVLNSDTAILFGLISSALTGVFLEMNADLAAFFLISSITAAASIAYADRRTAILKAGVMTGLVNIVSIVALKMVEVSSVSSYASWTTSELLTSLGSAFLGGTHSALYVLFWMPVVEWFFGYTTDIKLLELGNLNHPLLKDMIVKAPGTYHHSQLVAVLAEGAAEAIGANPILARVGAYFHDIGKIVKPLYFIENQMGGENRHEKLTPSMSALIIASHVKEGMELAQEHHLPQVVADMIPQHQGTKLITYFYNKAKEQEGNGHYPIKEEDYRYPGPRPQSREAGILLLADGVEAAVRSLSEKSHNRIQDMVQKIINKCFVEEQLDECDLTLKDLRKIADTFVRILIGIYHHRIEYPQTEDQNTIVLPLKKLGVVLGEKL